MATEYILNKLDELQHRVDQLEKNQTLIAEKVFPAPKQEEKQR